MSDKKNIPAFPTAHMEFDGMTLRDYFAAKALQGLISNAAYFTCTKKTMILEEEIFKRAYSMADGMLKERES